MQAATFDLPLSAIQAICPLPAEPSFELRSEGRLFTEDKSRTLTELQQDIIYPEAPCVLPYEDVLTYDFHPG